VALAVAPACGSSSHGDDDDDDGGSSGENGAVLGGSGGKSAASGGKGGTASGRGGSANGGTSAAAGGGTPGASGLGDAGADAASAGETQVGGSSNAGSGGSGAAGGSSGTGPRPAFSPKVGCYAPRWLTTIAQPNEGTDPLAVTNGTGIFMVTWLSSEEVNATETWANGVVSMDRAGLYPNPLDTAAGQGTNTHTGALAMGSTGDAVWLQDPGILGASASTTLRRWDQAAMAWDAPHVVSGMRAFAMRATFLDDHDILVVGSIDDEMVAVVYDHETTTWSEPESVGSLGSAQPTWGATRVAVTADGEGNAAVAWANAAASGARVMRNREWVGKPVSLSDDPMVQDFWDVAVVAAGDGNFEVIAGPQDEARGVIMQARTLGYSSSTGTVLGDVAEAGRLPQVYYIGAGQPITALRDIDGDLTVGSAFWTDHPEFWVFRRVKGIWAAPLLLANGNVVANNNIGMGLHSIALDAGGHALAVVAGENDELLLREAEKGSATWTDGVRIDTTDFRFNRRGVSLALDHDEPVIFFSAEDALGTTGNVAWTACHAE
jgi:hypothetical protein